MGLLTTVPEKLRRGVAGMPGEASATVFFFTYLSVIAGFF
jgi:hypothetical protein